VNGLGGTELLRQLRPDGRIANAQVRIGTSTVMVSEASAIYPAMPGSYYLYVDDADAALDRALKHGAPLEMQVMDMPYGDRQGGVKDAHENLWWLSQRLVEAPYEA
jgi:PhnB protein